MCSWEAVPYLVKSTPVGSPSYLLEYREGQWKDL